MTTTIPAVLGFSFIALVAILYSFLIVGATWANNRIGKGNRWPILTLRVAIGGFLLLTGLLAMRGVFLDFSSMPPKILFPILVAFIGCLSLAYGPRVGRWLREISQTWLIGLQSFRIIVEIQLYFLAQTSFFPKMMTFEGKNLDIIAGVTAPVVAWYVHQQLRTGRSNQTKKIVIAWNILGLVLLANVVTRGLFSAPTPFQQIFVDPPNTAIGHFPFIWLPTFVVPFALFLHLLSLRKVTGKS